MKKRARLNPVEELIQAEGGSWEKSRVSKEWVGHFGVLRVRRKCFKGGG